MSPEATAPARAGPAESNARHSRSGETASEVLTSLVLELTTFGGLTLCRDGVPVTGAAGQRSRLALLVLLATAGPAGMSRDKLMAYLWPDSDEERARHSLNQALYAIRKELGLVTPELITGAASLSLDMSELTADVVGFDQAIAEGDFDRAAALYTGPFLDGVYLRESPEFERWSSDQRARLAHEWAMAVAGLARRAEAAGDFKLAVGLWRKLAAAEPLNASHALSLMHALAESGDVAGALQHARVHETMLREELDAVLDAEISAFVDALRDGRWMRSPTVQTPGPSAPAPAERPARTAEAPTIDDAPRVGRAPSVTPTHAEDWSEIEIDSAAEAPREAPVSRAMRIGVAAALIGGVLLATAYAAVPEDLKAAARTLIMRPDARLDSNRIVVAPLENRTMSADLDVVGEMAADFIALRLQEANLQIVDQRTTAITTHIVDRIPRLLRPADNAVALARETGARILVSGRYYRQGDSLEFNVSVTDAGDGHLIRAIPTIKGPASRPDSVVGTVAVRTAAAIAAALDRSYAAPTVSLVHPPSLEAYERVTRAWQVFFARPADTATVFAELGRAIAIDSSYAAPYLMKGYILSVKGNWPALAGTLRQLDAKKAQLTPPERAAHELLQADLRGDLRGRLQASRELRRLSPGSAELALLVAVSASYLGRYDEALGALERSDPNRGMNLVTPMYWAWRSDDEHEAGRAMRERWSVENGLRQFPTMPNSNYSLVRSLAARGSVHALMDAIERGPVDAADPVGDREELALMAIRELRAHGHGAEAQALARRVSAEIAASPASSAAKARMRLATALYEAHDYAAAIATCREILSADSASIEAWGRLGTAARRIGDVQTANRADAKLAAWSGPFPFGRATAWRARLAAVDGRNDAAVQLLRAAVDQGFRIMDVGEVSVHQDPDFATLVNSAAYVGFLQSLREEREP